MNKLEILKRKNRRKDKLDFYLALFKPFYSCLWLDLEESEAIVQDLLFTKTFNEQLSEKHIFLDSDLLREEYLTSSQERSCYVFTDDFEDCGIFLVHMRDAIENAFIIAKSDRGNTLYILEKNKRFLYRISYYGTEHNELPYLYNYNIQKSL